MNSHLMTVTARTTPAITSAASKRSSRSMTTQIPVAAISNRLVRAPSAAAPEVLVRLHVEPHREERELRAEDQEQRDEHDRRGGGRIAEGPQHDLRGAERKPRDRQHPPQHEEENERGGSADPVRFSEHTPEHR